VSTTRNFFAADLAAFSVTGGDVSTPCNFFAADLADFSVVARGCVTFGSAALFNCFVAKVVVDVADVTGGTDVVVDFFRVFGFFFGVAFLFEACDGAVETLFAGLGCRAALGSAPICRTRSRPRATFRRFASTLSLVDGAAGFAMLDAKVMASFTWLVWRLELASGATDFAPARLHATFFGDLHTPLMVGLVRGDSVTAVIGSAVAGLVAVTTAAASFAAWCSVIVLLRPLRLKDTLAPLAPRTRS
jgi:hypothetical protein